jgi:hypothetical protein
MFYAYSVNKEASRKHGTGNLKRRKHWVSCSGDRNGGREKRRKHGVPVQKQTTTED